MSIHLTISFGDSQVDGDSQVEFWQNLEKKRITDHDFPPPNIFVGSENNSCWVTELGGMPVENL